MISNELGGAVNDASTLEMTAKSPFHDDGGGVGSTSTSQATRKEEEPVAIEDGAVAGKTTLEAYYAQVTHGSGVGFVAVNMSNSIVGAGIVGLPFALQKSGMGVGVFLLVAMSFISWYALKLVGESSIALRSRSYEESAQRTLGALGEKAVLVSQFMFDFGAALAYLMIAADTSTGVMRLIIGHGFPGLRQICILVIAFTGMLPLCLLRDISGLEKWSSLSIFIVIVVSILVLIKMAMRVDARGNSDGVQFGPSSPMDLIFTQGVLSFTFVCQNVAIIYYNTLNRGTPERFRQVSALAILGSAVLTALFGMCGYVTFEHETKDDVLNNFRDGDGLATLMRVLYVGTMVLTYPIPMFVCRQVLHNFFTPRDNEGKVPNIQAISQSLHLRYTFFIFLSSVSIVLVTDNLGKTMSLTGNVAGSALGYILPGFISLSPLVREELEPNYVSVSSGGVRISPPSDMAWADPRGWTRGGAFGQKALVGFGIMSLFLGVVHAFFF